MLSLKIPFVVVVVAILAISTLVSATSIAPLQRATTPSQLKSAVDSLPQNEDYFTEEVRDLFIAKKDLIAGAATVDSVAKFLFSFSRIESRQALLRTSEVQDLIINTIAPYVTDAFTFGSLTCNIAEKKSGADLYSNVESFSAILKSFYRSETSDDVHWIASSINNILHHNPSSNKLLNSLPVVEAFSFIIPLAKHSEAVQWISNALLLILDNNEEAQKKFATPEFLNIFRGMEKQTKTDAAKKSSRNVLVFVDEKFEREHSNSGSNEM
jgi:hypothetical protein